MPGLPTAAVLGYLLTVTSLHSALLNFQSQSLSSFSPSISTTLQPLRPEYHTDWPVSAPCTFAFHSQHGKWVCYGGPVKAASAGAKPSGAWLNG